MKVFRENPEEIFADLKKRKHSDKIAKNVIKLDKKWRGLIEEGNKLRAQRNSISREIGDLKKKGKDGANLLKKMSGIKERLIENEKNTKESLDNRDQARMRVPNILENEVPVGKDDKSNKEIGLHGPKPKESKSTKSTFSPKIANTGLNWNFEPRRRCRCVPHRTCGCGARLSCRS